MRDLRPRPRLAPRPLATTSPTDHLIERPLLQALEHPGPNPAVLLIDEVDRADEEFEAFLFEMLAENTVTVPEIGTLSNPVVSASTLV